MDCRTCGKAFSRADSKARHEKSCDPKKLNCVICDKTFTKTCNKRRHEETCEGKKCRHCDFLFFNFYNLTRHESYCGGPPTKKLKVMLAKSKWRGLRDYYRQQLKRGLDQPESMVGSSWAHFEEMSFLGPSMAAGRTVKQEEPAESAEINAEMDLSEALEQKWSPEWSCQQESEVGDFEEDDLHFFKSLLPDLRGLPRAKKAYIRLQIQSIIFEEVYGGKKSPLIDHRVEYENSKNPLANERLISTNRRPHNDVE